MLVPDSPCPFSIQSMRAVGCFSYWKVFSTMPSTQKLLSKCYHKRNTEANYYFDFLLRIQCFWRQQRIVVKYGEPRFKSQLHNLLSLRPWQVLDFSLLQFILREQLRGVYETAKVKHWTQCLAHNEWSINRC